MTVSTGRRAVVLARAAGRPPAVPVPHPGDGADRRRRFGVLVRVANREARRDLRLLVLVLLLPVLVVVALALTAEAAEDDGPFTVRVVGDGAAAAQVVAAVDAAGHAVSAAPGGRVAVDATVVVRGAPGAGDRVEVVVAEQSPAAARAVTRVVGRALPGATVTAELPDGTTPYDPATFLLPGILPLAVLVLALPGTVGPLVRWRTAGVLRFLLTAGGGIGGLPWALLPARAALAAVSAATTVLVCAAGGVLRTTASGVPALVLTAALGTAALLALGLLVAALTRAVAEVRVLLWAGSVVLAVLGGILLPFLVLPGPAAAVLGWTPTAVFADAWRALLTGSSPRHPVVVSWAVLAGVSLAAGAATEVLHRRRSAPRAG